MRSWLPVVFWLASWTTASAQERIVLSEVLGSWQGDETAQLVELQLIADGQQNTAQRAEVVFDDATASESGRRFFTLTANLARGTSGAKVLIATTRIAQITGLTPDFVLPAGLLHVQTGRVCYQALDAMNTPRLVDCLAYGDFTGPSLGFGPATAVTPENRSLIRVALEGKIRSDWEGALQPTPENNAGATATMATLCGDGAISQGEECDGEALGGATCASLGFAKGTLRCTQCHYDTSRCSFCGNGALNEKEDCDGNDLGERTCETLGFTGGDLACSERCTLDTAGCSDTFYVPGGGPAKADCQAEWLVRHAGAKPDATGKAPPRLKCRDDDPACDADATPGTCTLSVAVCFGRTDARLASCSARPTGSWTLATAPAGDPAAAPLVAAVAALPGAASDGTTVTFAGRGLEAGTCAETVAVMVAARGKLRLKSRATPTAGKPRDADVVRIACTP